MADVPSAQLLRLWWEAEKGIDLPCREQLDRLDRWVGAYDPADVLDRIEPDMGSHRREEHVRARPQALHANTAALQIGDAPDVLIAE